MDVDTAMIGAGYGHALVSLGLFGLLVLGLNLATGYIKGEGGLTAGPMPEADYGSQLYRVNRAYLNAVETFAVFTGAVALCILAAAAPFWINLLASLTVISRFALAYIHIQGIGKEQGGPRTMLFVFGFFAIVGMLVIGAVAALQG